MYKKDFINLKKLMELTGYSRGYIYKKMRHVSIDKETPLIVKEKGKATLYHVSLVDTLKGEKVTGRTHPQVTPQEDTNINHKYNIILEQKQKLETELEKINLKLENKEKKFEELLDEMNKRGQRHDTIVMTISKQLEAINEKMLLLEDKREEKKQEQLIKNDRFNFYGTFIKASTITILIIIYFKILYI